MSDLQIVYLLSLVITIVSITTSKVTIEHLQSGTIGNFVSGVVILLMLVFTPVVNTVAAVFVILLPVIYYIKSLPVWDRPFRKD